MQIKEIQLQYTRTKDSFFFQFIVQLFLRDVSPIVWNGDWTLGYASTHFRDFSEILQFHKIPSLNPNHWVKP